MNSLLRTICSIMLSLSLVALPMQSWAMMLDMQSMQQTAEDSGCPHGAQDQATQMKCCIDQCDQDCSADCSTHSSAATLLMAIAINSSDAASEYNSSHSRLIGKLPAPPLPPPLI